jgi:hypothetical protein
VVSWSNESGEIPKLVRWEEHKKAGIRHHRSHPLTTKAMAILVALALLALGGVVLLRKVGTRENGLPRGPPTIPLLGNLHMFPTEFAHYRDKSHSNLLLLG